nr:MAG TPA: hypothetical protein [Caudoviricetes sp.]
MKSCRSDVTNTAWAVPRHRPSRKRKVRDENWQMQLLSDP